MTASDHIGGMDRRLTLLLRLAFVAAVPLLYVDTLGSIVQIWHSSEAYVHGFLIPFISIALIWHRRDLLATNEPAASWTGFALLVALSLLWSASDFAGVQLTRQFAAVVMIPAAVLCVFGPAVFRSIRFALLYLLLAVPFGDFLIPYLIDFTAKFTVDALHLLGIPVFRDGRYFLTPSGAYEVAKACSGLKYFVATFALTTLFSYFLFARLRKRLLFIGFALLLSIVANGVRAVTVVLLLHYTDLDIAAGPDHEFVGWIVYALVLMLLIWVGNRFQDKLPDNNDDAPDSAPAPTSKARFTSPAWAVKAGALALAAASLGPLLAAWMTAAESEAAIERIHLPEELDGWMLVDGADVDWSPRYRGYSDLVEGRYGAADGTPVDVAIIRYASNRQGAEITNATNAVADVDVWTFGNVWSITVDVDNGGKLPVRQVRIARPGTDRLIWYWTEVNGQPVDGPFRTKLAELRQIVSGGGSVATVVLASSPLTETERDTELLLSRFVKAFYPQARHCLGSQEASVGCGDGMMVNGEQH